ncbi:2-hydroxy-6-oxo-6-phenylhexa-2,4-dienoate hydrolase [Lignipirellula cremea]|uniref:2-hydroxy-6-oxo-6-phenylhexa-2,4-dienoate hydrolase n=2 Tax=Lignipirellula cremea TaxID=2528010 RepID=A0A518DWK2_9BACT|nr:2-hydroxy-6-oxo-6-phenylhexa-2,4-dienoate hydrolase [Lignipirellula cremea]
MWLGSTAASAQEVSPLAELLTPLPIPAQVAAEEGHVKVAGASLWYWDTGGEGPAVVLVHPGTGSGLIWGYQQPVFAKAGYRVIGYSRKNYRHSMITEPADLRSDMEDLHGLNQSLGLGKFHAIGSAAGGGIVMQYAAAHPEKLLSMTIACSLGSVHDPAYRKASAALRPASFNNLPAEVRELGPCYRAADPEGVKRWAELERKSRSDDRYRVGPPAPGEVTWEKLNAIGIPTLLLGGDADMYTPPPMLEYFHKRLPGSRMAIIQGAGHSAYWEQPQIFNRTVLDFLGDPSPKRTTGD